MAARGPRRGKAGGSCAARHSGPAAVVLALGKALMQRNHLRRPPNSRTGQVRPSVRPPAPRRPGRNRSVAGPAPSLTPTVIVTGSGAGVSGCCGGEASTLGETTVYSPTSKSPLRSYARCPMLRAVFLAFVARGLVNPTIDVARGCHSGRLAATNGWVSMAPANARCGGPPPPNGGIETAGRSPKIAMPSTDLPCDCCP